MVYQVDDDAIVVLVLGVGKREDDDVYQAALETVRDLVARKEKR